MLVLSAWSIGNAARTYNARPLYLIAVSTCLPSSVDVDGQTHRLDFQDFFFLRIYIKNNLVSANPQPFFFLFFSLTLNPSMCNLSYEVTWRYVVSTVLDIHNMQHLLQLSLVHLVLPRDSFFLFFLSNLDYIFLPSFPSLSLSCQYIRISRYLLSPTLVSFFITESKAIPQKGQRKVRQKKKRGYKRMNVLFSL
jgi:hypothetical protein